MIYDATTTKIFGVPPYSLFSMIGIVFASSLFILLLLKYNYSIPIYTKIFFLSGIGLFMGAKIFGFLTGLFHALASNEAITLDTFINTGIVFYGGLIGFISSFLLICKIRNKEINYGVLDIVAVCIPLFHFWGRLGCFFGGCCFGIENHSAFSVSYTVNIKDEAVTSSRFPVQLLEAGMNLFIFTVLMNLLLKQKFKENLLIIYMFIYAAMRIVLEFFRGDLIRGVWNGVSFSQIVSIIIIVSCITIVIAKIRRKNYV
jgi:phosphatidylglycerol:prolipoprotein diacylglycerol transferase